MRIERPTCAATDHGGAREFVSRARRPEAGVRESERTHAGCGWMEFVNYERQTPIQTGRWAPEEAQHHALRILDGVDGVGRSIPAHNCGGSCYSLVPSP